MSTLPSSSVGFVLMKTYNSEPITQAKETCLFSVACDQIQRLNRMFGLHEKLLLVFTTQERPRDLCGVAIMAEKIDIEKPSAHFANGRTCSPYFTVEWITRTSRKAPDSWHSKRDMGELLPSKTASASDGPHKLVLEWLRAASDRNDTNTLVVDVMDRLSRRQNKVRLNELRDKNPLLRSIPSIEKWVSKRPRSDSATDVSASVEVAEPFVPSVSQE